ncbi:MAG: alpha/beta hydrolase [Planctomycetaceae bacterium]|nr:alpha/beta hydrolase [Planctomycetales bacterium]MCB9923140.1 alpha/beta hydrolase [Planctomycetaceae bacterium]
MSHFRSSRLSFAIHVGTMLLLLAHSQSSLAAEADKFSLAVWPDLAPGENSREVGIAEPPREGEDPPVTRLTRIRKPSLEVFLPENPNGAAILVLPGGGFAKVVPDKEGSEAAPWLNRLGIAVFVLRYRTNETTPDSEPAWLRPLQDAQRSLRLIRANAATWQLQQDRLGVLGFSAGGQVASILHTCDGNAAYERLDQVDDQSCLPDYSLLVYPWRVLDQQTGELLSAIRLSNNSPPAFIVHTHDDASSSLGSVLLYAGLKRHNVPAELHVYANGGHGYGMREVKNSNIGSWPDRASDWLLGRGIARDPE